MRGFHLFDTALGHCGIAWSDRGVVAVQLPECDVAHTRARLLERIPDARDVTPPATVRDAVGAIAAHLRGERSDLSRIVLDMEGVSPFHRRVYDAARTIPPAETLTYGQIAAVLGVPGGARAVGQALGRNPFAIVVPCHRVVGSSGRIGGFSASGGVRTKLSLLSIERAAYGAAADAPHATLSFEF